MEPELTQRIELVHLFTTAYLQELKIITRAIITWAISSCNSFTNIIHFLLLIFNTFSWIQLVYWSWYFPACFENSHYCSPRCAIFSINQPLYQPHPPTKSWHLIFFNHHNIPYTDHLLIIILHLNLLKFSQINQVFLSPSISKMIYDVV